MTLDEAIEHAEEVAEINQAIADNTDDDNWMDIAQCEKCAAEHKQLAEWLRELKELREQTRWIPVGDRLPGHYECVLACCNDEFVTMASFSYKEQRWECLTNMNNDTHFPESEKVIAWMPLPEPYRADKEIE